MSFPFTNWQVTESSEHGGGGGGATIYLTHPPVTQEVSKSFLSLEQQEDDDDNNMLVDEFLLQDDSILVDDNCDNDNEIESLSSIAVSTLTKSISNNNNNNNNSNNTPIVKVIWNLSVVYSETFQVPVLYFTLEYTNGCPVERRPMVSLLLNMDNNNDNDDDDNDWSSVSQDLHPETGRPSYFLHPCQTNDTLHNMMITAATTTITCPSIWMWTWMSMVLPAIGHGIPSKYFLDIQQRLLQDNAQVNA
jgi:ubiquitin-like-conjugating enzyme ATG10